jgi:16S rRNA (uracil1498-N3)-methyltransferase
MDRAGARFVAVIEELSLHHVRVTIERPIPPPDPSPLYITLCQALLKSNPMDLVVEKTSELGVDHIVPYVADRTVVKVDAERSRGKLRHWQEIAQSAAKQCDRPMPAEIDPIHSFDELLARLRQDSGLKILLWEQEDARDLKDLLRATPPTRGVFALVGPEGGFTVREMKEACHAGCVSVSLGRRILRAETAAISVVMILQYEWGDLHLH